MVHVTLHALQRYRERIADIPDAEIVAAIDTPVINRCAAFGDCSVKLASGHRLVIRECTVVTVTPCRDKPRKHRRHHDA
jgi:hypothetical protein